MNISQTGFEAYSPLNIGERYHQPLRLIFRKLSLSHPSFKRDVLLAMSVKVMNDTLGTEGSVPYSLVFVELPQIRAMGEAIIPKPELPERAVVANAARDEMSSHMSKLQLRLALRHQVPPAALLSYKPVDQVLVWRENIIANNI